MVELPPSYGVWLSMAEIRSVTPAARLIQTEDVGQSYENGAHVAVRENIDQGQSHNLGVR